jgi:hypothetical protein
MVKPDAYPFLKISRHYGLDYDHVLLMADRIRRTGYADFTGFRGGPSAALEIVSASEEQRQIRAGEIDWNTGEPIPVFQSP